MKAKCAVTFEFAGRAAMTWRGEVEGSALPTVVRRAADKANKNLRPRNWSSLVVVILERDDFKEDEE